MTQGTRTALVALLLLAACTDSQQQRSSASAESFAGSDDVQSWLGSLDAGPPNVPDRQRATGVAPVSEMIVGLEERLRRAPDDVKGWRLLARSYAFVGDMDRARSAADRAVALGADAQDLEATLIQTHTGQTP